MTGFLTVNFSDTDEGLFTTSEVLQLMRVEYDRAKRYDYPASLIVIEVDRLEYLHNLYGWESKEEILQSVIKTLRGIVPICSGCKKIRDDQGSWHQVEVYVHDHSEAEFSHGLCPDCLKRLYPAQAKRLEREEEPPDEEHGRPARIRRRTAPTGRSKGPLPGDP